MSEIIMWILGSQLIGIKFWVAFCLLGGALLGFGFSFIFPFYVACKIVMSYWERLDRKMEEKWPRK